MRSFFVLDGLTTQPTTFAAQGADAATPAGIQRRVDFPMRTGYHASTPRNGRILHHGPARIFQRFPSEVPRDRRVLRMKAQAPFVAENGQAADRIVDEWQNKLRLDLDRKSVV